MNGWTHWQAYTIFELFAGFNLIVTGLVKCLIMRQNAYKMHRSEVENGKIFWGGATPSPQIPSPLGRGYLLPKPHPLGACGT